MYDVHSEPPVPMSPADRPRALRIAAVRALVFSATVLSLVVLWREHVAVRPFAGGEGLMTAVSVASSAGLLANLHWNAALHMRR